MKTKNIFLIISRSVILRMRNVSGKKGVEKIKTHIVCSITIFRISCRLCDDVAKHSRAAQPQMAIWCMRIACWISEATNTHSRSEYVILIAFPLLQWLHDRATVLRHT